MRDKLHCRWHIREEIANFNASVAHFPSLIQTPNLSETLKLVQERKSDPLDSNAKVRYCPGLNNSSDFPLKF